MTMVRKRLVSLYEAVATPKLTAGGNGLALVKVIEPGLGSSGFYTPEVLQRAVSEHLFDNVPIMRNHPGVGQRTDKSDWDLMVGYLKPGTAEYLEQGGEGPGVYAQMVFDGDVRSKINLMVGSDSGLSIHADGEREREEDRTSKVKYLSKVHSVDLVVHPGAGGAIVKILESKRRQRSTDGSYPLDKETRMSEFLEELQQKMGLTEGPKEIARDIIGKSYTGVPKASERRPGPEGTPFFGKKGSGTDTASGYMAAHGPEALDRRTGKTMGHAGALGKSRRRWRRGAAGAAGAGVLGTGIATTIAARRGRSQDESADVQEASGSRDQLRKLGTKMVTNPWTHGIPKVAGIGAVGAATAGGIHKVAGKAKGKQEESEMGLFDSTGNIIEGDIFEDDLYSGEIMMTEDGTPVSEGGHLLEGIFDEEGNVLGIVEMDMDSLDEEDEVEEEEIEETEIREPWSAGMAAAGQRRASAMGGLRQIKGATQQRLKGHGGLRPRAAAAAEGAKRTSSEVAGHVIRNKKKYGAAAAGVGAVGAAGAIASRRRDESAVEEAELAEMGGTDSYGNQFGGSSNHGGAGLHKKMGNRFQSSGQMNEASLVEQMQVTMQEMAERLDFLENGEARMEQMQEAAMLETIGSNGARAILKESVGRFAETPQQAAALGKIVGQIILEDREAHKRSGPGQGAQYGVGGAGGVSTLMESADEQIPDYITNSDKRLHTFFGS